MIGTKNKFANYTIKHLDEDFPTNEACLIYLFRLFYGDLPEFDKYYLIKGRKEFVHSQSGHHISPLANTIFHKSSTDLNIWFKAIYKFNNAKDGISAMELKRNYGVTYKTAWRMRDQIQKLCEESS
jgi:transposase